jgi:predicted phosphodiesterase
MAFDFIIMGHTHYPMDIKAGNVRLVNPGSVGQPRTKEKGASWAILDTKTREVIFRSESYDSTSLINECRIRHPGIPYLAEVLCEK